MHSRGDDVLVMGWPLCEVVGSILPILQNLITLCGRYLKQWQDSNYLLPVGPADWREGQPPRFCAPARGTLLGWRSATNLTERFHNKAEEISLHLNGKACSASWSFGLGNLTCSEAKLVLKSIASMNILLTRLAEGTDIPHRSERVAGLSQRLRKQRPHARIISG